MMALAMIEGLVAGDPEAVSGWRRWVMVGGQFVLVLYEQIKHDKVVIRASGLAYTTLLAVVPLVAVLFALFSAFASFAALRTRVQEFLFAQLLPTRQDEIVYYINQFTANTNKLGFIGFVVLMVTAILLLDNIETNFNAIWHVTTRRRIINKITAYTSVLVFGTVFLGASLSISARLEALELTGRLLHSGLVAKWMVPLGLSFLAFLIMYIVIPFTRVRFASALVGAIIAAVCWEWGKGLFAGSVGQSVRYSTIYGSLAVIPIFLVWIYITWIVVLVGLEIAFTHQNFAALTRSRFAPRLRSADRLSLTLAIARTVADRFHHRRPPPTIADLSRLFRLPLEAIEERVKILVDAGYLRPGGDTSAGLTPATSLQNILVADLLRTALGDDNGRQDWATTTTRRFITAGAADLGDLTLLEALDSPADEDTGESP